MKRCAGRTARGILPGLGGEKPVGDAWSKTERGLECLRGKGLGGIQKSLLHEELERRVYAPTGRWIEGWCVGSGEGNERKGDTQDSECTLEELKRTVRRK